MDAWWPTPLAALGAAATTTLLVAVPVVELLATEFSALVALPLGLLAGLGALVGVGLAAAAAVYLALGTLGGEADL